ncbi:MAG: BatD family protein [Saprospiraceae bacterium]|nr:BatD family protein [Saprospiraceae bacterium]
MKRLKYAFGAILFLGVATFVSGQQGYLSVKVNKDTISSGEVVTVEFLLENLAGNFKAPDFRGFQVVSGPNTSSSFRMINGEVSQKKSYSYVLVPMGTGTKIIGSASVDNNGQVIDTDEIIIFVTDEYSDTQAPSKERTFIYDNGNGNINKSPSKKRPLKKI